ncbi:hypothetical protein [Saccharopolyspora shandongensis]|uniref:hypothetical protein n=1 Tax=Saccharopolyspora shandongensis TaxID=418495 RepID=UPI00340BD8FA
MRPHPRIPDALRFAAARLADGTAASDAYTRANVIQPTVALMGLVADMFDQYGVQRSQEIGEGRALLVRLLPHAEGEVEARLRGALVATEALSLDTPFDQVDAMADEIDEALIAARAWLDASAAQGTGAPLTDMQAELMALQRERALRWLPERPKRSMAARSSPARVEEERLT